MPGFRLRSALGLLLMLCAPACSVLEDYPASTWPAVEAFRAGRFQQAAVLFAGRPGALGSDEFLARAEQGMALHAAGDLHGAVAAWLEAAAVLDGFADRPTVSGRSLAENALSFVVNDKTLPYDGEGFEAALLHAFLAWDFLLLGKLDDALVEVRQGYAIQKQEEDRYESSYGMNRFARFVAALAQEMDGAFDEAALDLARLAGEVPGNPAVAYGLERARRLQGPGSDDEWARAQLVVIFEQGQMPPKEAAELVYPTTRTFGRVAVPHFGPPRPEADALEIAVDGVPAGRTAVVENVYAVARRNLEDRIVWIAGRSIARSAAKTIAIHEIAKEVEKDHGEGWGIVAGLLGGLAASWTEQADLRSWLSLPESIQVLRVPLPPGRHTLRLRLAGGLETPFLDLGARSFEPGRPVLVAARSLGGSLWAEAYGGNPDPRP